MMVGQGFRELDAVFDFLKFLLAFAAAQIHNRAVANPAPKFG